MIVSDCLSVCLPILIMSAEQEQNVLLKSVVFLITFVFYVLQKEQYDEALDWYNFSLSLYNQSDTGDVTLAKLHRNRANCYLQLQLLEKV